ncbi:MAG: acyl-CoA dehydrogenase family protein [Halioglobus sp.]
METFSAEDRQSICETFSRLLGDMANEERLRQVMETESGFDAELWERMSQLGLTGIMIETEHGGVGGSMIEVEALMEHAGEYLYNGPFIATCVIAPTLLSACNDDALASRYLREITLGTAIFSVAGCGASGDWDRTPDVKAEEHREGWRLNGTAEFVSHCAIANLCLVYAKTDSGIGVFLLDMDDHGVKVSPNKTNDKTLRLSSLSFSQVKARRLSGVGGEVTESALHNALVSLAGEQVGAARAIFEITTDYLKTRHQFGQAIGSFQALKHMAADLLIELESASSVARHAAVSVATDSEDQKMLASLAGFTCADNFRTISAEAIQLHGGIAYTMEHPAHLYWRRAQTGQWLYRSSDSLRESYLQEMEKML